MLRRLRRAKKTGATFERPAGFAPAEIIRYYVGAYTEKEKHLARVVLDPFAAFHVRETPWHEQQTFEKTPDGRTVTTLWVNTLFEIEPDILALDDRAEVLGSPELRERLRQVNERVPAKYRMGT